MTTPGNEPTPSIRAFQWEDLPVLHDVMARAGAPPYDYADDPQAALGQDLSQPRTDASRDVFLIYIEKRPVGWVRVEREEALRRAVANMGVAQGYDSLTLRSEAIRIALQRAREAGVDRVHLPVAKDQETLHVAARASGFQQVRAYSWLEYRPAPAYLLADHRPVPDGFRMRGMDDAHEAHILAEVQNASFEGEWGFAPNTEDEIAAKLALPGWEPSGVLFIMPPGEEEVAGYVWTKFERRPDESIGFIAMIGIRPEHRRRGLARSLLGTAIRRLRDRGAGVIRLEVDQSNKPARRLYRDMGFRRISDTLWLERELT